MLLRLLLLLALIPSAFGADIKVSAMTAASALSGPELFYCSQSSADRKCTATQIKAFTSSSPTLVTPILGAASATSVNKVTITAPATGATLTIPDGVTLNAGAGGTLGAAAFVTPGTGVATFLTTPSGANLASALTTALPVSKGGTNATSAGIAAFNNITGYSAAGATGTTSTNLVFSTSPALTTPNLGTPSAITLTNATGLPLAGVLSIGKGTSFPMSPSSGDQFFRTDLGLDCYYDGTRWLTKNEYALSAAVFSGLGPYSATNAQVMTVAIDSTQSNMWITRAQINTVVITTNNGTNFWTIQPRSRNAAQDAFTNLGSSFTTAADTVDQDSSHSVVIGAALTSGHKTLGLQITKTLSPGNLYLIVAFYYRLIVT